MELERGFAYLLDPLPVDDFFSGPWLQQTPLYIPGSPGKFQGLFDEAAFHRAIRNVPANLSLHLKAVYRDDGGKSEEIGCIGPESAEEHFAAGATLCATGIDVADPNLAALRNALRHDFLSPDPLLFNCYYSPDGHGFATHFDAQSVWILQTAGEKLWRYSPAPAYPNPSKNATARMAGTFVTQDGETIPEPDETTFHEAMLRPGDVLYLPAGTWHRPTARGSSLALTLTQPRTGMYSLLTGTLSTKLLGRREWRGHVPRLTGDMQPVIHELEQRLAELKAAVGSLTVVDLCNAWYKGSVDDKPQVLDQPPQIDDTDRLQRNPVSPLLFFESDNGMNVYFQGARYTVPLSAKRFFHVINSGEPVSVREAVAAFDTPPADAQELLSDFLQIGLVSVSGRDGA